MLKYNSTDTEKMINVFAALAEKQDNPTEISNEIVKLIDYPVPVLQEFLKCMEVLENMTKTISRKITWVLLDMLHFA